MWELRIITILGHISMVKLHIRTNSELLFGDKVRDPVRDPVPFNRVKRFSRRKISNAVCDILHSSSWSRGYLIYSEGSPFPSFGRYHIVWLSSSHSETCGVCIWWKSWSVRNALLVWSFCSDFCLFSRTLRGQSYRLQTPKMVIHTPSIQQFLVLLYAHWKRTWTTTRSLKCERSFGCRV